MTSTISTGRRSSAAGPARPNLLAITNLLAATIVVGLMAQALPAAADIMPPARRTTWNPGIPGGIPVRTTVCATILASTYGNGTQNASTGIQNAINACPDNQIVQLSAGDFLINGTEPIKISKPITLRGMGPTLTKLRKTSTVGTQLIVIGDRWLPSVAGSTNLTADAPKGATSVQVASTTGFTVGRLVSIDELTDTSYVNYGTNCPPGNACRGWFNRFDRPVGQMLEIASISGNTVTFTTPLHIGFDMAHTAQLVRYSVPYAAKYAGVEDLYVRGGRDDNLTIRFAMYSWMKNVESDWSLGDSIGIDSSFRCVVRDSYFHDTPDPNPGGGGYMLSFMWYSADNLVENNIFMNGNKVMVMRASGGGNVIAYNYMDNAYISYALTFVEVGINASHMACAHFELFEGNQSFNIDGDNYWGGAVANTFFRNHVTGKRRSYTDSQSRRGIGLMYYHYDYSFVGNVLGTADQNPAPYSSFQYEDTYPWGGGVPMWIIGYNPYNWNQQADARVVSSTHRHANWDYATDTVNWATGYDTTLPNSLYLASKPAFFGNLPWPWVDATGATKLFTLPARARFDSGNPNGTRTLTVVKQGTGSGTVTSAPAGISCGANCTASYPEGTVVNLTAVPAAGSTFGGWGGACTGTGACQVAMNASNQVDATFTFTAPANHILSVTKSGTGTGTVTSNPTGINCGTMCNASFVAATVVNLSATPAAGTNFAGWSGGCTGTGACQVTMNAATAVTATFTLAPVSHPLTVAKVGTGTGTVTSNPTGINCGPFCSANFLAGTPVALTAAPAAGSTFNGWTGGCTGTGSCQVTMNSATAVTATFNLIPGNHVLTVTKTGAGTGTVTSSPAGISCGSTCSASFTAGTLVTLTANHPAGNTFKGWSGACTGTGACQVTLNAAAAVTATFLPGSRDTPPEITDPVIGSK